MKPNYEGYPSPFVCLFSNISLSINNVSKSNTASLEMYNTDVAFYKMTFFLSKCNIILMAKKGLVTHDVPSYFRVGQAQPKSAALLTQEF